MKQMSGVKRETFLKATAAAGAAASVNFPAFVRAADARNFSFGYDQPPDTVYGYTGTEFSKKLEELSHGTMKIQQYANAQLGSEPEMAQKVRSGDMDFAINSTANSAAISPQAGVFSLQYLYASTEQCIKSVGDPGINDTYKKMIRETVTGLHTLGLMTWGLRNMYAKFDITSVNDIKGKKFRVQATKTEDAFCTAYGAIPIHMAFGQVYTSMQTGLVQVAENGVNVFLKNKHYEVAPVLSMTEHEANNYNVVVSDKTWNSLSADQKKWVEEAFAYVQPLAPKQATEDDRKALVALRAAQVKIVEKVDKNSFATIAKPLIDAQAKSLGPFAEQLLKQVRAIK